jgi:hypothetical protein
MSSVVVNPVNASLIVRFNRQPLWESNQITCVLKAGCGALGTMVPPATVGLGA